MTKTKEEADYLKPAFDKTAINDYFYNLEIPFTNAKKEATGKYKDFEIDIIYNNLNSTYWKYYDFAYTKLQPKGVKHEAIDTFKTYFCNHADFIKNGVITEVINAYTQYGLDIFKNLHPVPTRAVVFKDKLIYYGKHPKRDLPESVREIEGGDLLPIELLPKTNAGDIIIDNPYKFFFVVNSIPYDFLPDKEHKCPTIDRLFKEWLVPQERWNNPTDIDLGNIKNLYELIAYCMLMDYSGNKIFLLNGNGDNGKSTYMNLINTALENPGINNNINRNGVAMTLEKLDQDGFVDASLNYKIFAHITESEGKYYNTAKLKDLSSNTPSGSRALYSDLTQFLNYAKIIIDTNEIPKTKDDTDGWYRRLIFIDFPNKFEKNPKNTLIEDIPEAEFEALANICFNLLKDLNRREFKFTNEPSTPEKRVIYLQKATEPAILFIQEMCETGDTEEYIYPVSQFKKDFEEWYYKRYKCKPTTLKDYIALVRKLYELKRPRQEDSTQPRCYSGIKPKQQKGVYPTSEKEEPHAPEKKEETPNNHIRYTRQETFNLAVSLEKLKDKTLSVEEGIKKLHNAGLIGIHGTDKIELLW